MSSNPLSGMIADQVSPSNGTFSDWERCQLKSYCKWPVTISLIVSGIVILCVSICLVRCLCCGYSCCCTFFSFLSCCDCFGGCCDGKKQRRVKYIDHHLPVSNSNGYVPPAPMMTGGRDVPRYARFSGSNSTSKQLNEDALPEMPCWDTAKDVHVLDEGLNRNMEATRPAPSTKSYSPQIPDPVPFKIPSFPVQNSPNLPVYSSRPATSTGHHCPPMPAPVPIHNTPFPVQNNLNQPAFSRGQVANIEDKLLRNNSYHDAYYERESNSYTPNPNPSHGRAVNNINYSDSSPRLDGDQRYNHPLEQSYSPNGFSNPHYSENQFGPLAPDRNLSTREYGQPQDRNFQPRQYGQPHDRRQMGYPDFGN